VLGSCNFHRSRLALRGRSNLVRQMSSISFFPRAISVRAWLRNLGRQGRSSRMPPLAEVTRWGANSTRPNSISVGTKTLSRTTSLRLWTNKIVTESICDHHNADTHSANLKTAESIISEAPENLHRFAGMRGIQFHSLPAG
jgi:hypothetical protein